MSLLRSLVVVLSIGSLLPTLAHAGEPTPVDSVAEPGGAAVELESAAEPETDGPATTSDEASPPPTTTKKKKTKKKRAKEQDEPGTPAATDAPRVAEKKKKAKKPADDDGLVFEVGGEARLGVGALTGRGIHRSADREPVAMGLVAVKVDPALGFGVFQLALPSRFEHRETWQGNLTSSEAASSLELTVKPFRQLRATFEVGGVILSRPQWLDPYQPEEPAPVDGLLPTDRRSRSEVRLGARVLAVPLSKTYARLKYDFVRTRSVVDAAFDAIERPNHLTPTDHDEHTLATSLKTTLGTLKPGVGVGVFRREYFFVFSRDAGDGRTHAGSGGDPPNPLQVLHGLDIEPEAALALLDGAVVVDLGWRLRLVDDVHDGYYSRVEQRVTLGVEAELGPADFAVATRGRLATSVALFGDRSYAVSANHLPLDFGDRRELRRATFSFSARFPARAAVRAFVEAAGTAQQTNFPDYVPGLNPAPRLYDIDWDYRNASAALGIEMELDPDRP